MRWVSKLKEACRWSCELDLDDRIMKGAALVVLYKAGAESVTGRGDTSPTTQGSG